MIKFDKGKKGGHDTDDNYICLTVLYVSTAYIGWLVNEVDDLMMCHIPVLNILMVCKCKETDRNESERCN